MSIRRCQQEISPEEFNSWLAYYQIEPFGEDRADIRSAIIACTFANTMGSKNSKMTDFMPKFEEQKDSPEILKKKFEVFARMHNKHIGVEA